MLVKFQGYPTNHQNTTLYQHAHAALGLAKTCWHALEQYDNNPHVDLNSRRGTVVVDSAIRTSESLFYDRAAAESGVRFHTLQGSIEAGQMQATLQGSRGEEARVLRQETPDQSITTVVVRDFQQKGEPWQGITVGEHKTTGALWVDQPPEGSGPGLQRGLVLDEQRFAPHGPAALDQAYPYRRGEELERALSSEMQRLRTLDNSAADLNPEKGLVVTAGSAGPNRRIPGHTAVLSYDLSTGDPLEFSQAIKGHVINAFRREGDIQIYEKLEDTQGVRLALAPDGSRRREVFATFRAEREDLKGWDREHLHQGSRLPAFLDSADTAPLLATSAMIGVGAMGAAGVLTACALGPGLLVGAAVAAAYLALSSRDVRREVELEDGVNRFAGANPQDRFSKAAEAFEDFAPPRPGPRPQRELFAGQEGATRQACIEMFRDWIPLGGERLVLLAQSYGPGQEPAVVVIPNRTGFPVRMEDDGLVLPDGVRLPYSSIRAVREKT